MIILQHFLFFWCDLLFCTYFSGCTNNCIFLRINNVRQDHSRLIQRGLKKEHFGNAVGRWATWMSSAETVVHTYHQQLWNHYRVTSENVLLSHVIAVAISWSSTLQYTDMRSNLIGWDCGTGGILHTGWSGACSLADLGLLEERVQLDWDLVEKLG